MSSLLSILSFLLVHGATTLLWTSAGMLLGALVGGGLVWSLRLLLPGVRRRRPFAHGVLSVLLLVMLVPVLGLAGGFFGGAHAVRQLVEEQALLSEAAELGFEGAQRALSEAHRRLKEEPSDSAAEAGQEDAATLLPQIELGLRLVEGKERFPIDSLGEIARSFSDGALRRALAGYEAGHARLGERGPSTWIARGLGQRLLIWLIERPEKVSERWTEPVAADLRTLPQHADGLATGRELGLGVMRVHLQRPMARWAYLAVAIQGWALLGLGLLLLLVVPSVVLLISRLVRPLGTDVAASEPATELVPGSLSVPAPEPTSADEEAAR
jgi:hypothetical protein